MNILVVEDDVSFSRHIAELIAKWGYGVETCATGRTALKKFYQKSFDPVLLDLSLADTESVELIPRLKKLCPETGIITMTDRNSRELERDARNQGILFYMIKPHETECLKILLDHTLERMRASGLPSARLDISNDWVHPSFMPRAGEKTWVINEAIVKTHEDRLKLNRDIFDPLLE